MPEEPVNSAKIKYNLDTESGFSLNPAVGVLQPHTDHKFTLTYAPKEVWVVITCYLHTAEMYFYTSHEVFAVELSELDLIN